MIWLEVKGFPPFTKQSSKESLLNNLGLIILAEANQPQWRWILYGAHSDETQVFTICTTYWGIPVKVSLLCEMLMSLFVQEPNENHTC
jgi:hypothetical protein